MMGYQNVGQTQQDAVIYLKNPTQGSTLLCTAWIYLGVHISNKREGGIRKTDQDSNSII